VNAFANSTTLSNYDLPNYNLWVEDGVMSEMFWVVHPCIWDGDNSDCPANWGDYVFEEDYELSPLEEIKAFVHQNKHLPGIPPTSKIMEGYELHDMNKNFIVKIEELMLYTIDQEEKIKLLRQEKSDQGLKIQKLYEQMDVLSQHVEKLTKLVQNK